MPIKLVIDTSGTRCPIPLLKAKQALRTLETGDCLKVISTDPSSVGDFVAMLEHLPHTLVASEQRDGSEHKIYEFVIKKG